MPDLGTVDSDTDPRLGEDGMAGRRAWQVTRGALLYWLAALFALHLMDTGLDPVRRPISSYLNTDARGLATTWFIALSLMVASSIVWLRAVTRPGVLRALGSALFGIVATGIILAGMTPSGLSPMHRRLHMIGGLLTFPPLLVGASLWTAALLRDGARSARRYPMVAFAAGMIAALVVGVTYGEAQGLDGLFQRTLFACLVGWLLLAGREVSAAGAVEGGTVSSGGL